MLSRTYALHVKLHANDRMLMALVLPGAVSELSDPALGGAVS